MKNSYKTLFVPLFLLLFTNQLFSQQPIPQPVATQPAAVEQNPAANSTAQADPRLTAALQEAADIFNKGDFAGTLEKLKTLSAAEPRLAPPRVIMANWFARAQIVNAIQPSLDAATTESPADPEAFLLLGEISLKRNELSAAALFFERTEILLQRFTADAERKKLMQISLLRNRVALAEVRGNWEQMEASVDQRIALEGKSAELCRQKAVAVFRQKRDSDAAQLLAEADQLSFSLPEDKRGLPGQAFLSQLYISRGDDTSVEQGRVQLKTALERNPKSKDVIALSALMQLSDNKLDEARKLANQLLAEDSQSAQAKRLLATIALYQSDYLTAEKFFQELVVASPADSPSVNGLALALCEQGDDAKLRRALEYASENVRRQNNNSEFLGTLGWVLFKAKEMDQASKVLQQAAASGNVNSQTAYYLARLAVSNNQKDQAKNILEMALKNNRPFAKRQEAQNFLTELSK